MQQQQQKNTQHAIVCLSEWHPFLYRDAVFKADVMTGGDHAEVWHT